MWTPSCFSFAGPAFSSTRRRDLVLIGPAPSIGVPKASTTRPNLGTQDQRKVRSQSKSLKQHELKHCMAILKHYQAAKTTYLFTNHVLIEFVNYQNYRIDTAFIRPYQYQFISFNFFNGLCIEVSKYVETKMHFFFANHCIKMAALWSSKAMTIPLQWERRQWYRCISRCRLTGRAVPLTVHPSFKTRAELSPQLFSFPWPPHSPSSTTNIT